MKLLAGKASLLDQSPISPKVAPAPDYSPEGGEQVPYSAKTQSSAVQITYCRPRFVWLFAVALLALPSSAHASIFHGETLDSIANGISCRLKGLYLIRPLEGREARRFGFFLGPAGRGGWSRHAN